MSKKGSGSRSTSLGVANQGEECGARDPDRDGKIVFYLRDARGNLVAVLGEEPLDEEEDEEGGAGQVAGAPANPHHPDADKPSALAEYL